MKETTDNSLVIRNATENNLKGVNLSLSHDTFTVVTGLSGSGKSSLAFDTVYAEGQRRYIETFSPYTRQFFDKVKKPAVDLIENVRPALAIQQKTRIFSSRSTVGSLTDINDYLKILWSNGATAVCSTCDIALEHWTPSTLSVHLHKLHELKAEKTFLLCAAIPLRGDAAAKMSEIERLVILGYSRYFDAATGSIGRLEELDTASDELILVLERMKGKTGVQQLRDAIEQAFSLARGVCTVIELPDSTPKRSFRIVQNTPTQDNIPAASYRRFDFGTSTHCLFGNVPPERPRPSLFSYNHPLGACPECKGFGNVLTLDLSLCVPNPTKSIEEKCIHCWSGEAKQEFSDLLKFCKTQKIPTDVPWKDLSDEQRDKIINAKTRDYWGIVPWFGWLEKKTYKAHVRIFLSKYRTQTKCPTCNGTRLKRDALAYRLLGKTIADIWNMPIDELLSWLQEAREHLNSRNRLPRQLKEVFAAVSSRLQYLIDLGLPYLTLERPARTLSGGETQRVNLVSAIGSDLVSTHFVLDEPSVGLHARDTERLVCAVQRLHQRGNTILAVEHDPDFVFAAQNIIELGPKSGAQGGTVVFDGPAERWPGMLVERQKLSLSSTPPKPDTHWLRIHKATLRNLKDISVEIPLGTFTCLTGISGSGKSTLANEVLRQGIDNIKRGIRNDFEIEGYERFDEVLLVDQSPLARSPRANIATYTGMWEPIRQLLAGTEEAKSRSLSKSSFSFNVNAGRCNGCDGAGFIREDLQFLSDVYIPCELCLGKRFQPTILEVRYDGRNVDDFLQMTVEEAKNVFGSISSIASTCSTLDKLGLGHLKLGHSLSELSGGEAQRLKLVPYVESVKGHSLLIFDEPTTGLHLQDVQRLVGLIHLLKQRGHTILCIEHNLSLIAEADWIIDLGPEGGKDGGELLYSGTPLGLLEEPRSATGYYLKRFIDEYSDGYRNGILKQRTPTIEEGECTVLLGQEDSRDKDSLSIRGARVHNLKNIDIDIPLNTFVALIGVSGSGKSSIAKDIIYAEGQRRYLECLSPYARQFVKNLERPDIDSIKNIVPTICVYQHTFQPSSLSTVGTMSEVYNFLRLLYSKVGNQYCVTHPDQRISPGSVEGIATELKVRASGTVRLLAPVIKKKKGAHRAVFSRAVDLGITEVRADGEIGKPSAFLEGLEKGKAHTVEYVFAKFSAKNLDLELIQEAVSGTLALGGGEVVALWDGDEQLFSTERSCPICKKGYFKPDPEDLSFSSSRGRCQKCQGTGMQKQGATCSACDGSRLSPIGRNVRLEGRTIHELSLLTPSKLREFLEKLPFNSRAQQIAEPILKEVTAKLESLIDIGLDYLPLSRDCATLSGGELQRLRLATAMGSPLTGVMYIFDEPSAGLHPLDNALVLHRLRALQESKNSVIVIEHDQESILAADYIIEAGPSGGVQGGRIVFSGDKGSFLESTSSPTAHSIKESGTSQKKERRSKEYLEVKKGSCNSIKELGIKVPLQSLVVVAGVSGSGKSSLVHGIIHRILDEGKEQKQRWKLGSSTLDSTLPIDRVLLVDQKPIGASSRSTPASYLKIWDEIRKIFAQTIESKSRGWSAAYFSHNTGKGKCPECKGQGILKLEMSFLAEANVTCEVCGGRRFSEEAESVHYLGSSIGEILALTFEEAKAKFANHPKIHRIVRQACELGLGYLSLGQSSTTLSGGESQRIKLVSELNLKRAGHTLYILDEPTTGLHKLDVAKLLDTLHALVDMGHTVLLIEHDEDILAAADHIIEMGPGAGPKGGKVVFEGSYEQLTRAGTAWGSVLKNRKTSQR